MAICPSVRYTSSPSSPTSPLPWNAVGAPADLVGLLRGPSGPPRPARRQVVDLVVEVGEVARGTSRSCSFCCGSSACPPSSLAEQRLLLRVRLLAGVDLEPGASALPVTRSCSLLLR